MKYKLLLWDFDGTLADSLTIALDIYNRMAAEKKFRPITDPHAVRNMGMREFLKAHGISFHKVPFVFSAFLKEFRAQAREITLFPGVAEVLNTFSGRDILQGIVSSNSSEAIRQCLQANTVETLFQYVSGTSGIFGKEKRIGTALKKLNVAAQDVLYIGDEIRDIEAARAAGIDVAAVTWGLNSKVALAKHNPTFLVSTPDELLKTLE